MLGNSNRLLPLGKPNENPTKHPTQTPNLTTLCTLCAQTRDFQNTSAFVNISVLNVNDWDPRFRYPQYEFYVPDISLSQLLPGTVIGKVEAADGDRGDRVSLALRGPEAK